jgi:hypothetical protein
MRFFTRELLKELNSQDDAVVERATQKWEQAIQDYRQSLKPLLARMPGKARGLSKLVLHDARAFAVKRTIPTVQQIIAAPDSDSTVLLTYDLWSSPRTSLPASWPFSSQDKYWLYDELDWGTKGTARFIHRILFSDGSVLAIPFLNCEISWWLRASPGKANDAA